MSYHGDIELGDTIDLYFTTVDTSGVPATLSGTPVVSAYEDNGTTEITAGITLTADFDTRTGLNQVRVVAASASGYEKGKAYSLVITTGTVGGASVVGYVVGSFSIQQRGTAAQRRALDGIVTFTATTGGSTTSIPTSTMNPAANKADQFKGRIVIFDRDTTTAALRGQATDITASTAGGTLTVSALTDAPASGDTGIIV